MLNSMRQALRIGRRRASSVLKRELFHAPDLRCKHIEIGGENGSFVVNPSLIKSGSVVYSFGVGTDISFDLACIARFKVTVHAFDPTPRSVQWLATQSVPPEFHFHEWGVASYDGTLELYPPEDPNHVSYSFRKQGDRSVLCSVRKLSTIMGELGHSRIDLLKMDIEGSEYAVIDDMLAGDILPGQFCVEFHHRWAEIGHSKTDRAIENLRARGYRLFHVSASGEEFSFLLPHG